MSVDVSFEGLTVELGGTEVLHGVDLDIRAGQFVTLLGPSGSGKTTTLNVVAGFVERSGGHVRVGGTAIDAVPAHRRNIGFLFQNYALFPHMSVGQNVAFPLEARRVPKAERASMVAQALTLVRLSDLSDRRVQSLSGGQQQRVALARALVFNPSLLLLDEPLAALDKQLREAMQLELKRIQTQTGTTTISVTHDQVEAMSMSDRIAIMRDGRIEQVGTPNEVYQQPANAFVATFLGEANLLPVESGLVRGLGGGAGRGRGTAVIRPEDLVLVTDGGDAGADGGGAAAEAVSWVFQGSRRRGTLRSPRVSDAIVVSVPPHEPAPSVGDRVALALRGPAPHIIAEEDRRNG